MSCSVLFLVLRNTTTLQFQLYLTALGMKASNDCVTAVFFTVKRIGLVKLFKYCRSCTNFFVEMQLFANDYCMHAIAIKINLMSMYYTL